VRVTPEEFRANLEMLVTRCRERNSQVVLCTPNAVIDTAGRPIDKLGTYCAIIRAVGREMSVPVCDQYQVGNRLRDRAPWTWRLTLSDEIHPNMDGHKRMAEELCRTIAGETISLDSVPTPQRLLRVKGLLKEKKPIRVLAMPPFDVWITDALKKIDSTANVDVTAWSVDGKSIAALEQDAKTLVRAFKPDLVVLAVPRSAVGEIDEQYVHGYSWVMNWSLSFGQQEWDCVVVHPSVAQPDMVGTRDDLNRRLVRAQHLDLIDRDPTDKSSSFSLFSDWFDKRGSE